MRTIAIQCAQLPLYLGILTQKNENIRFAGVSHCMSVLNQFNASKIIYAYLYY